MNAGFREVNIDLIYGHDGQTVSDWFEDVARSKASGATSVTIHPLAIRKETGYKTEVSEAQSFHTNQRLAGFFISAANAFRDAGWTATSAVAFSNTDTGNPLEEAEANGIATVGLGAGARSCLSRLHTSSISYAGPLPVAQSLAHYRTAVRHGRLPIASWVVLSQEESQRRRVLLSLVGRGIDESCLSQAPNPVRAVLANCESEGLVRQEGNRLVLTDNGRRDAAMIGLRLASSGVRQVIIGASVA